MLRIDSPAVELLFFWSAGPSGSTSRTLQARPREFGSKRTPRWAVTGRQLRSAPAGSSGGVPRPATGQGRRASREAQVRAVQFAEHQLHDRRAASRDPARRRHRRYLARTAFQSRLPSLSSYQLSRMVRQHMSKAAGTSSPDRRPGRR